MTMREPATALAALKATPLWVDAAGELVFTRSSNRQLPVGVRLDHGDHTMLVPWAEYAGSRPLPELFTLDSLLPLTVVEDITCTTCGVRGRIQGGAWLPAEGGARG